MCLLVQSAAPFPAGFSIVRQHAGCTVHLPPPSSPNHEQLGAFAAQSSISLEHQRSHDHSTALRFLRFPSNCSHPWFRRTFVVTFCMRASHADVYPELLQDNREPRDHVQDGAPHLGCRFVVLLHPVVELRDMALPVCVAPACSMSLRNVHWTARCGLVLAPS